MEIKKVGVCGCGLMGSGIVEVSAKAGYEVVVREIDEALLKKGLGRIDKSLSRAVAKGKATEADKKKVQSKIRGTVELGDLSDCDLLIEGITENLEEKIKLYRELDKLVKKEALFASNTSSLSITEMAASTERPDKFVGLHFFNPVPVMRLVEVVRAEVTSEETYEAAKKFAESVGKTVVSCKDSPGFVVNRILVPYLLDAVRALESGVATKEDIDNGMKLGCGHPMGPLELADFVGLDTTYHIAEIMFEEFKDPRYAAPPLLKRLVKAGHLGRKTKKGFYDYGKE
ncbi:MAG: 3-hydroxybutyryl-CoA dehydrogenase [Candidatus Zixiibacteriota bacterium]|nr:MAG: 3-hydroxybutyryl-CoA dehydrogenase [candidate division Zixibacteria bacterium]